MLQDSDANEATGGTAKDNEGEEVKGIDNIQTLQHSYGEKLEIKENKTGNGDEVSTVYNVLDVYGRVVASYRNNDYNDSTGETLKVMVDGKEVVLNGIDSFETYQYNANGQLTEILRNLDAKGNAEEKVYIERDVSGNELGRYIDLDNNENTGMGNAGQDKAITLADGRVLKGVDRFETYTNDEKGNQIEIRRNLDAKGAFEEVEYRDVDSASGQLMGIYYNRDNDMKDGVKLDEKTGETVRLNDGRTVEGIDNFTTYERDTQNRVITERFNLDAKGADDRVYYYDLDANGNRIGEYQNLDNDTTLTAEGKAQITGTTHTLEDGRTVQGIERYYEQKFDGNNRVYERTSNLDGKDHAESVSYYVRDALGREVARYDNTNNDVLSNGNPNPTGHTHTIMLNGKLTEVTGIDRIVENTHNEYGNATQTRTNNTGEAGADKFTNITDRVYNERRQLESDSSKVKLESGEFAPSAANKYTYDIYGRQATREFDTDFSEDGFEWVETYHYNNLNQLVRTDRDNTGIVGKIDAYITYKQDIFNNITEVKHYSNAEGDFEKHTISEYDIYGNPVKEKTLNALGEITSITDKVYDQNGRTIKITVDRNGNGLFDNTDYVTVNTRDDSPDGNILFQRITYANPARSDLFVRYKYDDFNRTKQLHYDNNEDGRINDKETVLKYSYISDASSSNVDTIETYSGNVFDSLRKLHFSESNIVLGNIYADKNRVYHTITYNGSGSQPVSSVEDYTDSKFQPLLEKIGGTLKTINLSNATQSTDIALDNNVLAKLTESKLTINGDATDTVRLKGHTEFTQIENAKVVNNEYKQYTTEVGGDTYTLLIDTDINVVLA